MINCNQLRELIIKPALYDLMLESPEAEELLIFTCAVESLGGTYLKQEGGPAVGIYQMEPETHNDIWVNFIVNNRFLLIKLATNFAAHGVPDEQRLIYDLRYATALCRIHYMRNSAPLPSHTDVDAIWDYYKTHYNTSMGAATKDSAIIKYHTFIKQ